MVPDKFNMVDMDGIDLIMMQGEEVPGIYNRLVESITQCQYQCLYNWFFDGVVIPPTYVKMEVNEDDEIVINEGVSITPDDVIHIYSVEPSPADPEIIPLLAEENGIYNVPEGKDGFNPVTVNVSTGASTDFINAEALIPVMTSNITPSGVASASSSLGSNFEPFRAFNGIQVQNTMQQGWLASSSDNAPHIQYVWDLLKMLGQLVIYTANNGPTVDRAVTVEGLTQNDVWENCLASGSTVVLDFVRGTYENNCIKYEIPLNNSSYKGIKISGNEKFYGGPNDYACTFSEVQVYTPYIGVFPGLGYYNIFVPAQSFGENGNIYVNLHTGVIYQKQNGMWVEI